MRDIRVATVQFQHAAGDKAYNFGRIRHFVTEGARAARPRVELIAFPEMCLTGYWHVRKLSRAAFEALAEPVPEGPSTRDLLDLSREHGMTDSWCPARRRANPARAYPSRRSLGSRRCTSTR